MRISYEQNIHLFLRARIYVSIASLIRESRRNYVALNEKRENFLIGFVCCSTQRNNYYFLIMIGEFFPLFLCVVWISCKGKGYSNVSLQRSCALLMWSARRTLSLQFFIKDSTVTSIIIECQRYDDELFIVECICLTLIYSVQYSNYFPSIIIDCKISNSIDI